MNRSLNASEKQGLRISGISFDIDAVIAPKIKEKNRSQELVRKNPPLFGDETESVQSSTFQSNLRISPVCLQDPSGFHQDVFPRLHTVHCNCSKQRHVQKQALGSTALLFFEPTSKQILEVDRSSGLDLLQHNEIERFPYFDVFLCGQLCPKPFVSTNLKEFVS